MKTRKWLVVSSGLAALSVAGLYDADALKGLVKIAEVPVWLFASALLLGVVYLFAQYGLLIYQLWVTYDLALNERLSFRRADDLAKANDAIRSAEVSLQEALASTSPSPPPDNSHSARRLKRRLADLDRKARDAERLSDSVHVEDPAWASLYNQAEEARRRVDELKAEIQKVEDLSRRAADEVRAFNARVGAAQLAYDAAIQGMDDLSAQDPSRRGKYRAAEVLIDIIRIVPPGLAAVVSICALIHYHFELYDFIKLS
jgi:hypothetical protein